MSSSTSITDDSTRVTLLEAGGAEHAEHCRLVVSTEATKRVIPSLPGGRRQVLEQQRPESPALVLVGDHEGGLGRVGVRVSRS